MKTKIIDIGNSKGIRIPKPLIEESGLDGEVELYVHKRKIIIEPIKKNREGWDEAFKQMADAGDDNLIDQTNIQNAWDIDEWEW
jgi:antitoxin MazE